MVSCLQLVTNAVAKVEGAVNGVTVAFREGRVEHEPAFTDRMLGRIEQELNGHQYQGVFWGAKTFTDRGRGSQESWVGADFAGVLSLRVAKVSSDIGFLAQAKRIERGSPLSPKEFERFRRQCQAMLRLTPASFGFLYSTEGVLVVPAISVVNATHTYPDKLFVKTDAEFFRDHFGSFVGDPALGAPTMYAVEELMRRRVARRILRIAAERQPPTDMPTEPFWAWVIS